MNVLIAQRLAELRRAKGYSQESLAHELGLSRQAVSKWERAESSPDTENLIALARLYGVSLDDLLRLDDDVRDDVAFEHEDRAQEQERARKQTAEAERAAREAQAAADEERAANREAATRAAEAAAQASNAAARAAEAAAHAREQTTERNRKGPWRSFPYAMLTVLLFFVFGYLSRWSTAWLIFLTIPIYRWVAGIMDEAYFRRHAQNNDSTHTENGEDGGGNE